MKDTDLALQSVLNTFFGSPIDGQAVKTLKTTSLEGLFSFCRKQDIIHLVFPAIKGLEVSDTATFTKVQSQYFMTVLMQEEKQKTAKSVYGILENGKIKYMPLKGELVAKYYPETWMRNSCDVDVLIEKGKFDTAVKLLRDNGYTVKSRTQYDVSFRSPKGITVELHHKLLDDDKNVFIKDRIEDAFKVSEKLKDSEYGYKLTDDYFYYYNFVHLTKHFAVGGCGLKHFFDLYFINENAKFDFGKGKELIEKNGLKEFFGNCVSLSYALAGKGEYTPKLTAMLDFVCESGAFGTEENKAVVYVATNGGRFKYFVKKVFLPRKYLAENYPIVDKHKILTPVFEVVRWFNLMFRRRKGANKQGKNITAVDKKTANERIDFYKSLGINIK